MKNRHRTGVLDNVYSRGKAVALALLLAAAAGAAQAQGPSIACADGGSLSLAEVEQGTTIAVFWASWSPRSRDVFERINAIAGKWGGQARVVAINYQEDPGEVRRFLAGRKANAPVCFDVDGSFSKKFKVSTLPVLLILKNGSPAGQGRLGDDADSVIAEAIR